VLLARAEPEGPRQSLRVVTVARCSIEPVRRHRQSTEDGVADLGALQRVEHGQHVLASHGARVHGGANSSRWLARTC